MRRRGQNELFSTQILQVFDALIVWVCFVLAAALHPSIRSFAGIGNIDAYGLGDMMWIVYIVVPLTPLILEKFQFYEQIATKKRVKVINELFQSILLVGLIVALVEVVFKFSGTRRLIFGTGLFYTFGFLWLRSVITRRVLLEKAKRPENLDHVVLAGNSEEIASFLKEVESERLQTWRIVSHFDMAEKTVDELGDLLKKEAVQRVVFLTRHTEFERVARAVGLCEVQGDC